MFAAIIHHRIKAKKRRMGLMSGIRKIATASIAKRAMVLQVDF